MSSSSNTTTIIKPKPPPPLITRLHGLIGFLLLHFYTQLIVCPSHIIFGLLTGKVNPFALTRHLCNILGVKFYRVKNSPQLGEQKPPETKIIYLCNHRSWADFFCDQVITGGAAFLARMMVWVGTPVSSLYAWMSHSTWFFNRKRGIDRVAFAKFMDDEWKKRPAYGMIAYPEGHRNSGKDSLPLKTGVLQYAYEYKHAVQCVISSGKEKVCNEKNLTMERNQRVVTCCSEVIHPKSFATFEEFVAHVRQQFIDTWAKAFDPNSEVEEYVPPMAGHHPEFENASVPGKVTLLRVITLSTLMMVVAWKWVS
jgi:1-acyl-sn-glycerol-3-phosphate acyltransferase